MASGAVGFIGLGRMGAGMARHLLKKTGKLLVFDLNPEAVRTLEDEGAEGCNSPAELAARCELILLCLPFAPEVRQVLFGEQRDRRGRK